MPGVRLGSEGLGRYIGNLIKGFTDDENQVCIACPKWLVNSMVDLFSDFHVDEDKVKILTTLSVPVLWSLFSAFSKKTPKAESPAKTFIYKSVSNLIDSVIDKAVQISSWMLFALAVILAGIVCIALSPVILLAVITAMLVKIAVKLKRGGEKPIKAQFWRLSELHRKYSETGDSIQEKAYKQLYNATVNKLISKINRLDSDVWFVPALFWPEANRIKHLTVFTAPDLVSMEFPFQFAESHGSVISTDTCTETVRKGKYFITYSDYIKYDALEKNFGKAEDHVVTIPHINNTSLLYVGVVEKDTDYEETADGSLTDQLCRELLYRLPDYSTQKEYLRDFNFEGVQYIFYASQFRPHKNILNLVKAYEYLLRRYNVTFKLFLTCDLDTSPWLSRFIDEHGLKHHVIAFRRIPVQLLAALYRCALLVVNPTLYEGGFLTFTIGEAMSVGTPLIMGKIPQVTDVIPSVYPLEHALFDPYDYKDIAEKIMYGVENAQALYYDEIKMYQDLEQRTGKAVSAEYVKAFRHFMELDRESKEEDEE